MAEKYLIHLEDQDVTFEIKREQGETYVRREGWDHWKCVELDRIGDSGLYLLMVDNRPIEVYLERRRGGAIVNIGRHNWDMDVSPWRPGATRKRTSAQAKGVVRVVAPMTGSIVEVRCEAGQAVKQGDVLLVIESMKMNNELRAPAEGIVEGVEVDAGQKVKANDLLVAIRTGEPEAIAS
ncbi:MAG: biotin/lipoyl-binding protein [Dehalococcoidia bacterium]|nr:biotin/lipoyl-binding protein [Dehalococcoidia bacterium]